MAVTASQFLNNLEASGLLDREDLSAARALVGDPQPDGQAIAVQLVQARKLTPYQAKQLLAGNTRGFFLEKYKILEPIGRGGMGLVFKAEHTMLSRVAAIKVLPRKAAKDREAVERFRREARATAQLEHENIMRVYDISQQGEAHFIAMEFVNGQSLSKTIKARGRLSVREAVSIAYQVAQGLEHAFSRGIIHRDIKPSNILITPEGKAKILDMGLARVFGLTAEEGANQLSLTMSGTVVGTVDYVAPEQADDSHRADVRSDIYSLGCTLYECITGRVPFPGGTMMQKLMKHYRANPTEIAELVPNVPQELVAIIKRMMAKQPQDRYQRHSEVAAALLPLLSTNDLTPGAVPVIPLPAEMASADPNALPAPTDATLSGRQDMESAPDASYPTLPTIPLGTAGRNKRAAEIAARRNQNADHKTAAPETVTAPLRTPDTKEPPAQISPAPPSSPSSTGQQPAARATDFDITAMDWSTVRTKTTKPHRRNQSANVNEILEAIAVAASESPPSAADMPATSAPTITWTQKHTIVAASVASIAILLSGAYYWNYFRPGTLVLQYPEPYSAELNAAVDAKAGRILIDGKPVRVVKHSRQAYRLSPGQHRVLVDLPDLNRVSELFTISAGLPLVVELTPTQGKRRQWELADLTKRADAARGSSTNDSTVAALLSDLNQFVREHRTSAETPHALALRSRFNWPADRLKTEQPTKAIKLLDTPHSQLASATVVESWEASGGGQNDIRSLAFSHDGQYLASGRADGTIHLWDIGAVPERKTLGNHGPAVVCVGFSADNQRLISVRTDKIVFWNVGTATPQATIDFAPSHLVAAALSAEGHTVACAFQEGDVIVYDTASGVVRTNLNEVFSPVESLAISSSGTVLGSGGKENVELWDIPNGRRMGHVNAPGVAAMSFSNDDQWLSMVGKDGAARVWQAGASRFSVNVAGGCSLLAFSPAIATVAGVKDGRSVQLFHTTTGDTRGAFEMDSSIGLIRDLVFAPDTRHIAVADSQGTVRVIRLDYAP